MFRTRSFTAIVAKLGPKSRIHWIPSSETEKVTMILCKLTVNLFG